MIESGALFLFGAAAGAGAALAIPVTGRLLARSLRLRSGANALVRQRRARRDLERLRLIDDNREAFLQLRELDPLVFEDLVLAAYADTGASVQYTLHKYRDGGIDGEILHRGQRYAMQAKRYRGRIDPGQVRQFVDLVRARGDRYAGGVLVHSGRTGSAAWTALDAGSVRMVSGQGLLALIRGAGPPETWLPRPGGAGTGAA
ncbi:MAG: restriction endonuclease [Alphaproteobacteria bacterium]|nr:restriction endonuclease [Alphaproteobacteria bacterium]